MTGSSSGVARIGSQWATEGSIPNGRTGLFDGHAARNLCVIGYNASVSRVFDVKEAGVTDVPEHMGRSQNNGGGC